MKFQNLILIINFCFVSPSLLADLTDDLQESRQPSTLPSSTKKKKEKPIIQNPAQKQGKKKASKKIDQDAQRKLPIHYSSQNLRGTRDAGLLELKSNVVVTQGSLKVTSNDAKILFNEQEEMEKVEAIGNVRINTIDPESGKTVKAHSDQLTYKANNRIIVLDGNAKLWRGNDMLQGQEIQYNLDTGWIKVQKVKGQLSPSEKAK